jgi:hypothetical protein
MSYLKMFLISIFVTVSAGLDAAASQEFKLLIDAIETIRKDSDISATAVLIVTPDELLVNETLSTSYS